MGIPVLILGEPGSGKTYSIKGMDPEKVGIFSVRKGRLPFKGGEKYKILQNATYKEIYEGLKVGKCKSFVIDDSQYLMADEYFAKANESGFQKFTNIGKNFADLLLYIQHMTADDVIVYLLHHPQVDDRGFVKSKTVGKMVDNYLTIEGCVDICLMARADGKHRFFITQSDGTNPCKCPEGMFDGQEEIPNDLGIVDAEIREYWGIK